MKHYPMPERYRVILDYLSPKALRHTFKNYKIITTQDYILKRRQKLIRDGKRSETSYKEFEQNYLIDNYGVSFGRHYNQFYRRTKKDKF